MIDVFVSKIKSRITRLENWCKEHENEGLDYGNEIEEQLKAINDKFPEIDQLNKCNKILLKRVVRIEEIVEEHMLNYSKNKEHLQIQIDKLKNQMADQIMQMQLVIEGYHSLEERLSRVHEL